MNEKEFEKFLHVNIPITKAMEFKFLEYSPKRVRISARLEPNVNDKGTGFGGSISTLMTLCGWAMATKIMALEDPKAQVVVQSSKINYLKPVTGDFTADCSLEDGAAVKEFLETYRTRKKARLKLKVDCYDGWVKTAEYEGKYVALGR